jgi:hypothetical protein
LRPVTSQSGSQGHGNGGLDVPAMSILRRDSISSDGEGLVGNALGMEQVRPQVQPQQQQAGTQGASEVCPSLLASDMNMISRTNTADTRM